jgi:hypothetical protein
MRNASSRVVRPTPDDARELAGDFNKELAADGWQIVEIKEISGKPVFCARETGDRVEIFEEPTGWQKVDRQLQEMRLRLDTAESEEQYQAVGLLCREALISVAQEVYDPARHRSSDGTTPSDTDAKRMFDSIFDADLKGTTNEEARAHAKAAVRLALALQHKRTADFRTAAVLCGILDASKSHKPQSVKSRFAAKVFNSHTPRKRQGQQATAPWRGFRSRAKGRARLRRGFGGRAGAQSVMGDFPLFG